MLSLRIIYFWLILVYGVIIAPTLFLDALPDLRYVATAKHGCTFCEIIAGKKPSTVIYETNDIVVIDKRHKHDYVDCLIIPKKHIENLFALNKNDLYDSHLIDHIIDAALHLATMITGKEHFTLENNNGSDSYQTIFHMHWHFRAHKSYWKSDVGMQQVRKNVSCEVA